MRVLPLYTESDVSVRIERTPPLPLDRYCTRCALAPKDVDGRPKQERCMSAALVGPDGTPVLHVVGPGPTQQEDRMRMPFAGAAGSYVRQVIKQLWSGQVLYDNALRCAVGRDKIKPKAIDACRPYLAQIWQQGGAARVVLLGREAMVAFLGEGFAPLSVRRGYTHTATGVPVFLLMHPSMPVRNRFLRGWFEQDLAWALSADPPRAPVTGVVQQVLTEEDLELALGELELAPWVTFDAETYGAAWNREARILDVALTPGGVDTTYSFPRETIDRFGERLFAFLARPDVRLVGHGLKHDQISVWAQYGIRVECAADTLWLRRYYEGGVELALEEAQGSVGMLGAKGTALDYAKAGAAGLRKEGKNLSAKKPKALQGDWWFSSPDPVRNAAERELAVERVLEGDEPMRYAYAAIPPDERAAYNARDTVSTDRLYRRYQAQQDDDGRRAQRVWDLVGRDMQHALMVMEGNGIKPDRAKIHELIEIMDRDMAELEAKIDAEHPPAQYGRTRWNFHSGSPDTAHLLFDVRGLVAKQFTPTGKRQCTAEIMEKFEDPVADAIIAWRQRSHFKSQYGEGMLQAIRDDGRIHCSIKGVGTETGRPSSEDPNLFNLPRTDTGGGHGKACRDMFMADDAPVLDVLGRPVVLAEGQPDEWVLFEVDQSQVELRVAGMLSGDKKMIQVFLDDGDIHLSAAIETAPLLRIDADEVRRVGKEHPHRSNTKAVVFGALYGEPDVALAKKLGISRQVAAKLQRLILGHYDRLHAWCQEQLAFGRKHGFCYTWWQGQPFRKRWLTDIGNPDQRDPARDTAERSSWNTPIQGTAADYTNASLGAIQRWIERRWDAAGLRAQALQDYGGVADAAFEQAWRVQQAIAGPPARLVLTVYDSILIECRRNVLGEVARESKRIMESWPTLHNVPLVADCKVGKRFGSLEKYRVSK